MSEPQDDVEAHAPTVSGPATRLNQHTWALACGIHTARRALRTCPVCARAYEETVAHVDEVLAERRWLHTGAKAVATKIERYGSTRHNAPPPKSNAVTLREARKKHQRKAGGV